MERGLFSPENLGRAFGETIKAVYQDNQQELSEVLRVLGCALSHNLTIQENTLVTQVSHLTGIEPQKVESIFNAAREAHLRKSMGLPTK